MLLKYAYRTLITFAQPVFSHTFMLRCVPYPAAFQKVISSSVSVIPNCLIARSRDSFGNVVQTGYIADMHDAFMFESTGLIEVGRHCTTEELNPLFRHPSALTEPSDDVRDVVRCITVDSRDVSSWVSAMSDFLAQRFVYQSGATNVSTTAAEALKLGRGVCQDYAHIAISMCRQVGIPARYVNGFMIGEGATHAWIEYYNNGVWMAFDPTNNKAVDDNYIKIAQGRDFNDCSINRGRFCGITQQSINIRLNVEQMRRIPNNYTE